MYKDEEVGHEKAAAAAAAAPREAEEEKPELVLVAEDGVEVRISEPAARMSQVLLRMIEDDRAGGRIPAPNDHSEVLQIVVGYCEKHGPHYDPVVSERDRNPFLPFVKAAEIGD